ncbi:MAG: amidohydrolase [Magnetococcales bacterium]|nr:amidohydrolase [Magnetococcales bacterium]
MNPVRRSLLAAFGTGAFATLSALLTGCTLPRVWNPCHADLPLALRDHPLVGAAWEGIDPQRVWDCHTHLAGIGDSGSGITLAPEMTSIFHPLSFTQRLFYLNAGCVHDAPGQVDQSYVERMLNLLEGLPPGVKLMLLAFDRAHNEAGQPLPDQSAFYVPNDYACGLTRRHPPSLAWVATIHPYRRDAIQALEQAKADGARAVKWLPPAMGIDPAADRCQPFYRAMARLDLPLLTHGGEEKAVHGVGQPEFGNPLRLRRALDAGVRTIIAHCASLGEDHDSDHGNRPIASFALFSRMMADPAHRDLLFGDISAITLRNRDPAVVRTILERDDWHSRLLNGSDYPLPGILPMISLGHFVRAGLLDVTTVPVLHQIQEYNPLLFDFVLKRQLAAQGRRLPSSVFATRDFFMRNPG